MKYTVVIVLFFVSLVSLKAEKSFERDLIERLVRLETKMDNNTLMILETKKDLQKQIDDNKTELNKKIDGLDKKIDDTKNEIRTFEYWAFGILISILFAFASFILWDRRTAVAPLESKSRKLELRIEHLETVIKAISNKKSITPEYLEQLGVA